MIVWQGGRLIVVGCVIGTTAAFSAMQALKSLLCGVTMRDSVALLSAVLLLACTALAATLLTARRAIRVDLAKALRRE